MPDCATIFKLQKTFAVSMCGEPAKTEALRRTRFLCLSSLGIFGRNFDIRITRTVTHFVRCT